MLKKRKMLKYSIKYYGTDGPPEIANKMLEFRQEKILKPFEKEKQYGFQ